jgi:acetolactate decarboxylase
LWYNPLFLKKKEMKLLLFFMTISWGLTLTAQNVLVSGKAKNVMMGIDLSSTVFLDTLNRKHLYGVGPVEDLQGEITIYNGEVISSVVLNKKKKFRTASNAAIRAPFLVYAQVAEWVTYEVPIKVTNNKLLEAVIDSLRIAHGIADDTPFPFLVEGNFLEVSYHIIRRNKREKEHNHEAHNKAKVKFGACLTDAILVGFYSTQHEGVFTHKGQYIHVHYLKADKSITGHLDELVHDGVVRILLPKN